MSKYMGFKEMFKMCERFSVETVSYLTKRKLFVFNLEVRLRKEKGLSCIAQIYYGLIMLYTLVIM